MKYMFNVKLEDLLIVKLATDSITTLARLRSY